MSNNQINVPITADTQDLAYTIDEASATLKRGLNGMSKNLQEAVKASNFQYSSLQEAYSKTIKHAELLSVTLGTESTAYKDAIVQAQKYGASMVDVQNAVRGTTNDLGKRNGQLSMAMAQLTREAPAFTYSMSTGFMAISNNIPILIDEINRLKVTNQGLAASGQATKSVFSSIVGALFSWQTAISLGITVITVFGERIWDSVTAMVAAEKATSFLEISTKKATDSIIDQTGELYKRNAELRIALNMANLGTLKDEEQIKINDKLIQQEREKLRSNEESKSIEQARFLSGKTLNELSQSEVKIIEDKIFALETQNTILRKNVEIQKELERLSEKSKKNSNIKRPSKSGKEVQSFEEFAKGYKNGSFIKDFDSDLSSLTETIDGNTIAMQIAALEHQDFLNSLDNIKNKVTEWAGVIGQAMSQAAASFGAALVTGEFDEAGKAIIKMLGNIAVQIGAAMIAMGVPMLFSGITTGQGLALVAGGTALSIVGGAMAASGSASKGSSNGGGLGGSYSNYGTPSYVFSGVNAWTLDGTVRGQDLVISTNNTRRDNRR